MYQFLLQYLDPVKAQVITMIWYIALILLILGLVGVPVGKLRYLEY